MKALAAFLYPSTCVLCRRAGQLELDLCAGCERDLPWIEHACERCAAPLASGAALVCGACLRRPPAMHAASAAFLYSYPVDRLVQGLKYRGAAPWGRVLGALLARHVAARGLPAPEALIPTPLSHQRYRVRGFNQSHEIALQLSSSLRLPVRADLVVRQRDTQEQASLGAAERRRNVRGAFALAQPLRLRHVAIVDDVMTTGSTARELAKVLRRGGATNVEVWVVARTAA
jgi:ComF family protein